MQPPVLAPARAALEATDLLKTYGSGDTAVRALDGVTVAFAVGEFTAIMGPSGSGKSTLMHCLAGLDTPASGSVRIGGTEISGLGDRALTLLRRQRVGFSGGTWSSRRWDWRAGYGTGRASCPAVSSSGWPAPVR